jgi:hypothetical protein
VHCGRIWALERALGELGEGVSWVGDAVGGAAARHVYAVDRRAAGPAHRHGVTMGESRRAIRALRQMADGRWQMDGRWMAEGLLRGTGSAWDWRCAGRGRGPCSVRCGWTGEAKRREAEADRGNGTGTANRVRLAAAR